MGNQQSNAVSDVVAADHDLLTPDHVMDGGLGPNAKRTLSDDYRTQLAVAYEQSRPLTAPHNATDAVPDCTASPANVPPCPPGSLDNGGDAALNAVRFVVFLIFKKIIIIPA